MFHLVFHLGPYSWIVVRNIHTRCFSRWLKNEITAVATVLKFQFSTNFVIGCVKIQQVTLVLAGRLDLSAYAPVLPSAFIVNEQNNAATMTMMSSCDLFSGCITSQISGYCLQTTWSLSRVEQYSPNNSLRLLLTVKPWFHVKIKH